CTTCRCCSSSVRNKRGAEGLALGLAGQATRTFHRARRFTTVSTSSSSAASVPPFPTAQFGTNEWLVEEMYQRFLDDPASVDSAWHDFFADYRPAPDPDGS